MNRVRNDQKAMVFYRKEIEKGNGYIERYGLPKGAQGR